MKKYVPFLLGFVVGILPLKAAETTQNDTTIRFNQKIIYLEDSIGQIKVKVYDNDSQSYKPIYEGIFTDGKSYEKWTVIEEIGIQLPFLNKSKHHHHREYSMEPHWAGIGWGFANISDQNYKLNNIDGVSLKSESSNEFFFSVIERILPVYRNNVGLTTGLGFNWKNYFLDRNTHLMEVNDVTSVYSAPAGINYDYSRLRTFQITVPLLLEIQPTLGRNHRFFVAAGVVGGVNTFASYKVKYKDANGNTVKNVESKGLNVAPLTLDFMGQIGYGSCSVYAKYSPFSIFQSKKGPDVRAVSLGAMLNF
ncbi:MAG: PorT family protein [Bacteroidales bacterium]|nr:PorT family protein [Bacteroidales bacterium]